MRAAVIKGIGNAWWFVLARLGLSRHRWQTLPRLTRRTVKAIVWVAIGLVLVALFGVWKTSALGIAAVVLVLVVPPYDKVRVRGRHVGKGILPVMVLALAVAYPFYGVINSMPQLPIFGPIPQMSTMVGMAVFTMMALGLNFVVGYAGLLDLGYVAFYAMGSYMAGWFASDQFAKQHLVLGAVGIVPGDNAGFHFSIWLVLLMAGIATAIIGVIIGLPTLRLRGDYLAIVTLGFGEIMPQIARNGDNLFGFNLTNGTGGITPIDGPGFGNWAHHNLGLPANYLSLGVNADRAFFWTALVLVLLTVFTSSRLRDSQAGPRLGGDPGGRGRRGGDGRAAHAHEDVGVRHRRVLRRRRRCVLRELQRRCVPGRVLLQHLRLHPVHGHPRRDGQHLGRHLRRLLPRVPRPRGAREHRRVAERPLRPRRLRLRAVAKAARRAAVRVRDLRRDPRHRDALPAGGADPELAPRGGVPRGRARRAALRRRARRAPLHAGADVMPDALLQTLGLRKEFGGLVAVDDVTFTVPEGSIVSLIGPNGAGKTTFFNMLTGVYKPTAGRVVFAGEDLTTKPPHAFTQRGIGRTFQNIRLFKNMTALENVLVGMHVRLKGNLFEAIIRTPRVRHEEAAARTTARELLEFSGLRRKDEEISRNMSYGDQRRLEVARALATKPKLLLLDEPTAGMNPQETLEFTEFVGRLRTERGLTVLLIEHDMRVVMGVSDRVTVLDYGEKIAEGTPQEIQRNERVIEAYLGTAAVSS